MDLILALFDVALNGAPNLPAHAQPVAILLLSGWTLIIGICAALALHGYFNASARAHRRYMRTRRAQRRQHMRWINNYRRETEGR